MINYKDITVSAEETNILNEYKVKVTKGNLEKELLYIHYEIGNIKNELDILSFCTLDMSDSYFTEDYKEFLTYILSEEDTERCRNLHTQLVKNRKELLEILTEKELQEVVNEINKQCTSY